MSECTKHHSSPLVGDFLVDWSISQAVKIGQWHYIYILKQLNYSVYISIHIIYFIYIVLNNNI